jgi:uncharacterized protein
MDKPPTSSALETGSYPGRAAIDAYGNGGFRFAHLSHRGSLLVLPDRMDGWPHDADTTLTLAVLAPVLRTLMAPWFLLLGTGPTQRFPEPTVRRAFADARIGLDVMDTGAAARTYNVLLAEGRPVAALFVAV